MTEKVLDLYPTYRILEVKKHLSLYKKSNLCIFRFEDVIFNLYPHMASLRRKGMTIKEIFMKNDPVKEPTGGNQNTQ